MGITSHENGGSDGEDMFSRLLDVAMEEGVTVSVLQEMMVLIMMDCLEWVPVVYQSRLVLPMIKIRLKGKMILLLDILVGVQEG